MRALSVLIMPLAALAFVAPAARADDLGAVLAKGPLVRIETDEGGKYRQATCIADVAADADTVWRVLTDYEQYQFFMPRMTKLEVTREGNEKHRGYVEARMGADEQHQKAMELREQMIGLRNERRAEYEANKKELYDVNRAAREAVTRGIEEKAEEGLEALKKGGKISFGI